VAGAEPFDLGPLATPWTDAFTVSLLGGATAGARGAHFECSPRPDADHPCWQFSLVEDNPAGSMTRVVATLRSEENHLRFEWDPAVQEIEGAAQLSNCVLRLTSGAHTHDVRLRKPRRAEPLRIDLKKQSAAARAKVPTPPDSKQVRFQITAVTEPLPRSYTISPPEPIAVNDANLQINLGADPESQVLLLELKPELKTVFQLKCETYFRVKPDTEPVVWVLKKLQTAELLVAQNQEAANQRAQQIRNAVIGLAPKDPVMNIRQAELKKAEADLAECTKMTRNMASLTEIRAAVASGAAIHFRVFFLADDCEVDLLRTGPDAE
jgi:hypothetical protein